MDANFWQQRWAENRIGFHRSDANPLLVQYFEALNLPPGRRIFLPLCGKTLDIAWLLAQGYRVVGAELVETAIQQLFAELGVEPTITRLGAVSQYSAENLDIFVGDIFEVAEPLLGPVDAIYDRAALVALPEGMRSRYTAQLKTITHCAPQLLITFDYDQSLMAGPPFAIDAAEVERQYGQNYEWSLLATTELAGGLKGQYPAQEQVWLLKSRD